MLEELINSSRREKHKAMAETVDKLPKETQIQLLQDHFAKRSQPAHIFKIGDLVYVPESSPYRFPHANQPCIIVDILPTPPSNFEDGEPIFRKETHVVATIPSAEESPVIIEYSLDPRYLAPYQA